MTHFGYDGLNRPTLIDYPAPDSAVVYTYTVRGDRAQMLDSAGLTTWSYDAVGRPLTITDPFTGTVGYAYR